MHLCGSLDPEQLLPPTCASSRGCGCWRVFEQAGCAASFSRTGRGFDYWAALLRAGGHLRDGVSPDAARSASRAGLSVILHHGGQHGDVVALGSYHCVLVDNDVPGCGDPRMQRMLFWNENSIRGRLNPKSAIDERDFLEYLTGRSRSANWRIHLWSTSHESRGRERPPSVWATPDGGNHLWHLSIHELPKTHEKKVYLKRSTD